MHMLSLRDEKNGGKIVGVIFWRDMLGSEMRDWSLIKEEHQRSLVKNDAFEGWMKIELVCTSPQYYGKRIGSLLLASALVWALKVLRYLDFP